tara:strand:- start:15447 stop:16052 length:606 start_codon:yes stop_codon:yes gene_type:complete
MLSSVALTPFNHILLSESWAKKRLQSHIGKTIQFCISPFFSTKLTVQESGELVVDSNNKHIDAIATCALGLLPRLFVHDKNAYSEIDISGDILFAKDFIYISKNLNWDVEQDLSHIIGDVLAHRMVRTSTNIKYWHRDSTRNLLEAIAEYYLEEQPLLANSAYVKKFNEGVDVLKKKVDQLTIRTDKLNREVLKITNKDIS